MPTKRNFNSYFQDVKNVNINRDDKKGGSKFEIEGLLKPVMKNGKFSMVLRFLPSKPVEGEDVPFVENRSHMMQLSNGLWFGCDCAKKWPGERCPVCDYNSKVWTKYGRTDEARAKVLPKWRPDYYTNVYVVKNPNQPDTEGKVFRLKFSRAIMKYITDAMADRDDAELGRVPGINPFSWYGPEDKEVVTGEEKPGANFIWEGIQGSNGPNYDTSHFGKPSRISKLTADGKIAPMTNAEIDEVESQLWTLKDIEKQKESIKSYDEILNLYKTKSGEDMMGEFADNTDFEATTSVNKAPSMCENTVAVNDDEIFGSSFESKSTASSGPFDDEPSSVDAAEDDDDFFSRLSD